jgi:hypothetical protein
MLMWEHVLWTAIHNSVIYNMTIFFPFIHTYIHAYTYNLSHAHTHKHTHTRAQYQTLNNINFVVNLYLWIIKKWFLSQARNYFRVIDIKGRNRRLNGQNRDEGSCCLFCHVILLTWSEKSTEKDIALVFPSFFPLIPFLPISFDPST